MGKISEAKSKEKQGLWDPMPELTIYSPYVRSRVDSNAFTIGIGNPVLESNLKGPKREIFVAGIFAQIRPIWIGYLGTRP